jgi:hypothetical protein
MNGIADLFVSPALKFVIWGRDELKDSFWFAMLQLCLGSSYGLHVDTAMFCLKSLFEHADRETAKMLFDDFVNEGIVERVLIQFQSSCAPGDSLSIRCALARLFWLLSNSASILDQAVMALAAPIVAHLETIPWYEGPSELWVFVEELPKCTAAKDSGLCSMIFNVILDTFTIEAVDVRATPVCASVLKFIDSICDDESFLELCYERQFPAVILHHIRRTPDDDFVEQCLQLLTKFVEYRPVQSPIYPGFVSEIAVMQLHLLESMIPLALLTCAQCSSPEDWTKYAVEAAGMEEAAGVEKSAESLHADVKVFYAACIWLCCKRLRRLVVSPGRAVPILSDMLGANMINSDELECLLELFLAYLPTDRTSPEFASFLDQSCRGLRCFKEFAAQGSASAQNHIQLVNELLSEDGIVGC